MAQPQFNEKVFLREAPEPTDHVRIALEKIKARQFVYTYSKRDLYRSWTFDNYTLMRCSNGVYGLIYRLDSVVAVQQPYNPLFESLIARVRAKRTIEI
ncbi:MAG: hypothetical protein RR382_08175 [Tannerellaceae bacterium]